ncbi:MAG TPA: WHG domain-containing protein, partial [Candidatus Nocardiopsis merdipullorum]|nr:WHG domain-containing protein [Candidatus Nocardiopsis merdipullorum]
VGTGVLPVSTDPVEVLSSVLRGFAIPEEQHVHVIRGLRSALHGFVDLEITGGFGLPEDVDTSFALLVEVFVRTLSDRPCDMAPWESKSTTRRD